MFYHDGPNPDSLAPPGGGRPFRFTTSSIFNTLMVAGSTRYATNTDAGVTTLWRVHGTAELAEVARIVWPSSDAAQHAVIQLADQSISAEQFLTKPKRSLFHNSSSRYFQAGSRQLKWSEREWDWTQGKRLVCFDVTDSGDASAHAPVVANLLPPCPGIARPSLSVSVTSDDVLERILLTAILMVGRDTWRSIRQALSREELVEHIVSHAPSVYGGRRRIRATARRPRTAAADQPGPSESDVTLVPWIQAPSADANDSLVTLVPP